MSATLDDLPTISVPDSYALEMPSFLARMAARHGPIFKCAWGNGQTTVYLVGPEANKLILHRHRDHFSHDLEPAMVYYSPVGFIATGVELRVVPRERTAD